MLHFTKRMLQLAGLMLFAAPVSPSLGACAPKEPEKTDYRVLIASDLHYTTVVAKPYYGISPEERLQAFVDAVLEEHKKQPFDLIVIAGDVSLDYWGWNGGGSYQRDPSVSETKIFMDNYASQLPADVPCIVLPGNHELYTNQKWRELTGNGRNASFALGKHLFLMPDSYSGAVDPDYLGGGKNDNPYAPVDMAFIQGEIEKHPECEKIYLISHHFDLQKESEEFRKLLMQERRIVGLFSGHTHKSSVITLDPEYYYPLKLAQTGSLADMGPQTVENFNWGFRDLVITADGATSRYISPSFSYVVDGEQHTSTYRIKDTVDY